MLVAAAALAVVLVSVGGIAGFALWNTSQEIAETAVAIGGEEALPPSIGAIEGGVNLLLVGTDSCAGQDIATFPRCADDDGGERNDVTMLVHISDNPRRVTVVSIPRDMVVSIPSCANPAGGTYSALSAEKINASYGRGGLACTVATVEKLTGEDIQFAAAIRWTGVINLSDAIGGVDVCVAGTINDGNTGLHLTAGNYTLKGAEALQFLRIRHGIGDGSDLGRISNQQQFMSSLVRKLQSEEVLTNPSTLFGFATVALQQVTQKQLVLSEGLANPTRMVQIAMALKDVPFKDFVFIQYPTGSSVAGLVPVTSAATVLFTALRENKALSLTGEASPVNGVEVKADATTAPTASAPAAPSTSATPSAGASAGSGSSGTVSLPSSISGSTADQVTCTQPQK